MSIEKIERNNLIVKQVDEGRSFLQVADIFGLGKSTISNIYWRAKNMGKYKVRRVKKVFHK